MEVDAGVRERFLTAVRKAQREAVLLAFGAAVLSVVVAAIFGLLCYVAVVYLGALFAPMREPPPIWMFLVGATVLFLAAGAYYYRLKHAPEPEPWEPSAAQLLSVHLAPAASVHYLLLDPTFLGLVCALPGLVFHLGAAVFATRHLAGSRETIDLAVELITGDPERVSFDRIEAAFEREPQRTCEALELLSTMGFVLPRPRASAGLTLSMRCQIFLGLHDRYSALAVDGEGEEVVEADVDERDTASGDGAAARHSR